MRYLKYLSALLIIALMLFQVTAAAYEENGGSTSYTYDENGNDVSIPDAYTFKKSVDITDSEGVRASDPHGLVVSEETGKTYVVDTGNNRILVFSDDFSYEKALSEFKNGGETLQLNQPEGMFVYKNGDLLIADTQNNRIIKCNADGNVKQVIERPENMTGVSDSEVFLPVKLAVDSIGRIYVVARNINRGIIQLDSQGKFMGYIGSPQVQYDIMTIILRRFYTEAQQAKSEQFVPTEYNNICMDGEDFLWATISSLDAEDIENTIKSKDKSGSVTPVKKLNTMGTDVLKRNGFYAPMGESSGSRPLTTVFTACSTSRTVTFSPMTTTEICFSFSESSETRRAASRRPPIYATRETRFLCWTADSGKFLFSVRHHTASLSLRLSPASITEITRRRTDCGRSSRAKTQISNTLLSVSETQCLNRENTTRRSNISSMPRIRNAIPIRLK